MYRTLRVYSTGSQNLIAKCSKADLPSSKITEGPIGRIFHDDSLKSYFRRLTFSPDGLFLIVPSGIIEPMPVPAATDPPSVEEPMKPVNATYMFIRNSFTAPVMYYPSGNEYTVAVRCCPTFFKKKNTNCGKDIFDIPYRIIFAVATKSSVLLYDTEHANPFAYVTDIHYARLTDIAWSTDGRMLIASSIDGYCTIVNFKKGELGEPWENKD